MKKRITKQQILDAIKQLPEDATVEDALEALFVLRKVDSTLQEEESVPHEEVVREFRERARQRTEKQTKHDIVSDTPMAPKVSVLKPLDNYRLLLTFTTGEKRILDMKPYMFGVFARLEDLEYFNRARVVQGCIEWPHGQDFHYDMLYHVSTPTDT